MADFIGEKWKLPYTAQQLEDAVTNQVPRIGASGNWEVWDISTSAWVDTGVAADPQTAKIDADDIAPVEATSTASQNYAVNCFLVYGGQLYRVTAAIAQGDTLTVGTNIAAADVGTYLAMVAAANAVANAGVAPGGFGWGETSGKQLVNTDNLDNITTCGIYYWSATVIPANAPPPSSSDSGAMPNGVLVVYPCAFGIIQECYFYREPWCKEIRYKYGTNAWTPWEFENPRLAAGKEYRTTERFNGKPVYAKLLDFGALPNATTKTVAHSITNLATVLECTPIEKTLTNGSPYLVRSGITEVYCSGTNAVVVSSTNLSSYSVYVKLKYTKSTD